MSPVSSALGVMKAIQVLAVFSALVTVSGASMASQNDMANQKPTPQMIEEAKKNPNGWVYAIQGSFGPKDAVPPEAIAGAWKVSPEGKIVEGSFVANPKFKGASR
jgi:hypothetical protein